MLEESTPDRTEATRRTRGFGHVVGGSRASARAIRAVAFWAAALLPLAYLPVLGVAAVASVSPVPGLILLGVHAVALLVGHGHAPGSGSAVGREADGGHQ